MENGGMAYGYLLRAFIAYPAERRPQLEKLIFSIILVREVEDLNTGFPNGRTKLCLLITYLFIS